jgi:hypothetical protein
MRRFHVILEERQYTALNGKADLLSVTVSELIRRAVDRYLGLDGEPAGFWTPPRSFTPRRPGVKFTR